MRHAAQKCFSRWGCCSTILATSLGRGFWSNLESSMGGVLSGDFKLRAAALSWLGWLYLFVQSFGVNFTKIECLPNLLIFSVYIIEINQ